MATWQQPIPIPQLSKWHMAQRCLYMTNQISILVRVNHHNFFFSTKQTIDVVDGISMDHRLGSSTAEPHNLNRTHHAGRACSTLFHVYESMFINHKMNSECWRILNNWHMGIEEYITDKKQQIKICTSQILNKLTLVMPDFPMRPTYT